MKSLSDTQWDRFSDLVECLNGLPIDERKEKMAELRKQGIEEPDVLSLLEVQFRIKPEENVCNPLATWVSGGEPLPGYVLVRKLGKGGFGEVWQAEKRKGHNVALKAVSLLHPAFASLEVRAMELLKQVRHPHLLSVYDAWQTDDLLILEMELADRTLRDRLREVRSQGLQGIPVAELLPYMTDAAEGIDYLNGRWHVNTGVKEAVSIQHRDIKPENLLLQGGSVKVGDFGLAKPLVESGASHSMAAMTYAYAPPEAWIQRTESQSDQYSLAVTYYELRTGSLEIRLDHPLLKPSESRVVERALSKKSDERWEDCRSFVTALCESLKPLDQNNYSSHHLAESIPEGLRHCFQSFEAFMHEWTRGFLGRDYISEQLDSFLHEEPSGYFIIKALPGMGKSALVAHLVRTRGYIHHFNISSESINTPAQFLRNVCAQIIIRYRLPHTGLPEDAHDNPRFLNQLLQEASRTLIKEQPLVICIDALDEVKLHSSGEANVLFLPQTLPPMVYIVLTTRPLDMLDSRSRLRVSPSRTMTINEDSEWNRNDVRRFLEAQVGQKAIITWMNNQKVSPTEFVELLLQKSEGNFMYLRHVLPALQQGAEKVFEVTDLPQGLLDYYRRHWSNMQTQDAILFDRLYRPVVCVLAAAKEPVSIEFVGEVTGLEPREIERVLRTWREFLYPERATNRELLYRVYHSSFREFLEDEVDPGLRTYKRMLANIGLKDLGIAQV